MFIFAKHLARLGLMAVACSPAWAQGTFPTHAVAAVSPFTAGGPNDTSLRVILQGMAAKFGGDYVVENKPGATTRIANQYVARAKPDGHTWLYAAAPIANFAAAKVKTNYDLQKDFAFIGPVVVTPLFLVVKADSPYRSVADFVSAARSRADGVTFANSGYGASPHLTAELFSMKAGFKLLPIQMKGDSASYIELLAGRVDATLTSLTSALPFIQEGRLRVLAVASPERSRIYPDAPTFKEAGYPDVVGFGWFGLLAPKETPTAVVQLVNQRINELASDAAFRERLLSTGVEIAPQTPEQFKQFVNDEVRKWGDVMKENNIKLD